MMSFWDSEQQTQGESVGVCEGVPTTSNTLFLSSLICLGTLPGGSLGSLVSWFWYVTFLVPVGLGLYVFVLSLAIGLKHPLEPMSSSS